MQMTFLNLSKARRSTKRKFEIFKTTNKRIITMRTMIEMNDPNGRDKKNFFLKKQKTKRRTEKVKLRYQREKRLKSNRNGKRRSL